MRNEIKRQKELVRSAEVKFEQAKATEKAELVQAMQKIKKLEVSQRELKAKA